MSGRPIHPVFADDLSAADIVTGQTTTARAITFDVGPGKGGRSRVREILISNLGVEALDISFAGGAKNKWFRIPGVPANTHPRVTRIPCNSIEVHVKSAQNTANFSILGVMDR